MLEQYRRDLERQLDSKKYNEAFKRLKNKNPIFHLYPNVESLCDLFKPQNKNYAHKDEVMTILLTELHKSNAIYPVINIIFWANLCSIYYRVSPGATEPDMVCSRIQWDFYQSLMNYNLEKSPRKINVNIYLKTRNRVIDWEKQNLRYKKSIIELEELCKANLSPADLEQSRFYPEEMEAYLLDMVYRDVITKTQYDLILETRIYKKMNQKKWAKKIAIPYNTVRSLMHRAERAIRRFEKEREKNKNKFIFFCNKTA